jgi:hypothetical protein
VTRGTPLSPDALLEAVRSAAPDFSFEAARTREGVPTLRVDRGGKSAWLHSRVSPLKEAEKIISGLDLSSSVIVAAGFGLGYHVEALRRAAPGSTVAVLEKDPGVLKAALETRPEIERLFRDPEVLFFADAEDLIAWLQDNANRSMAWLIHRPSFDLDPGFYSNFRTLIQSFRQKRDINIATLSRFERIWARNIARNVSGFLADPGVSECFEKFRGRPFVLVGAGPSLDASLGFLREAAGTCAILAVDSVLPRLLAEGIEPDLVFAVDPQLLNYYFFYLCRKKTGPGLKTALVYEPSCHFLIPRRWRGPRMSFDSIFPLIQWVTEVTGEKGKLDMGGSVSTTAFDFAVRCGADPIVLVGQDMAFDRDKTHGRGSLVEYVLLKQNNRTATLETRSQRLTFSNVSVKVRSNSGATVSSDRRLLLFYWWFANKMKSVDPSTRVVSIAPKAAAVTGISFMGPAEALALVSGGGGKSAGFAAVPAPGNGAEKAKTLSSAAAAMAGSMRGLLDVTRRAEELSLKLYELVKTRSRTDRTPLLRELDSIDRTVEARRKENRLIGITMQKILFAITEGADDFLTEDEKKDKDLSVAKRSLVLYREIARGAAYNLRLLEDLGRELAG